MFERFTQQARSSVVAAQEGARTLQATQILPAHVLLGAVASAEASKSPLAGILTEAGITSAALQPELLALGSATFLNEQDAEALQSIGIDLQAVRRAVEEQFGPGALDADALAPAPVEASASASAPRNRFGRLKGGGTKRGGTKGSGVRGRGIPFSRGAKSVLENSLREAAAHRDGYIGAEHIVLGVIRTADPTATALISSHTNPVELATRIRNTLNRAA
ncbi:Clp protease N-terminal domain-containing protein [Arthrobacter koreensis]|uniref:Clp protease N-terminal domain-containing protein n=1 Tax=Arthrobacter koreensis TaxID=199136 RepID=UPI002DB6C947|nr:Clp protease N-terminal domain-containing protein [Arthrobacter koreensis]